jgi:hypothetical protein
MPDGGQELTLKVVPRIADVAAEDWDACARPHAPGSNPFLAHAFFHAAEASESAVRGTGWQAQHVIAADEGGRVLGAVPLYLKGHSYGEYVFDWAWADAYERAGGRYYPKLQSAVPFTPVTGPRLLLHPAAGPEVADLLVRGLLEVMKRSNVSSLHVTFPTRAEWELFGRHGFLLREGQQFYWHNRAYKTFDDFLAQLSSRKRKMIRKERAQVAEMGITIETLNGAAIKPEHWDAFFDFYMDTAGRKWGQAYLTRDFFERLGATLADSTVLVIAYRKGQPIAGALNMMGGDALYGRNWGALEHHPFLHFEVCYYRAMDFAIERGLARVEAGAGGSHHKPARGYMPEPTYSAHYIPDEGFAKAVDRFLKAERRQVAAQRDEIAEQAPFKRNNDGEFVTGIEAPCVDGSSVDAKGRRFDEEP